LEKIPEGMEMPADVYKTSGDQLQTAGLVPSWSVPVK